MEIPGGRRSNAKPSGTENPVGWGVKVEKTLHGGGVWICSGTTHYTKSNIQTTLQKKYNQLRLISNKTKMVDQLKLG